MNPLRTVYVDHGEAYGNLGDEAMLLSALDRLSKILGPCRFIVPYEPGKPLPERLPPVELVASPRLEYERRFHCLTRAYRWLFRIPGLWRVLPERPPAVLWHVAAFWLDLDLMLDRCGLAGGRHADWREFWKAIRHCDLFYGVGAADFNDYYTYGVLYKTWLYRAVRSSVAVSTVSAQGIGPVHSRWIRRRMKRAFGCLDVLSFRDSSYSQDCVRKLKPRHVLYKVVGDEAFALAPAGRSQVDAFLAGAGLSEKDNFIAIHFRQIDYTTATSHLLPRIAATLDGVLDIVSSQLLFIPMSYHSHSGMDEEYGKEIKRVMRQGHRMFVAPVCRDVRVVKGAVGAARLSLGLSYHLHVFSLSQGHPALILYTGDYYRYKSEGLISFYGSPSAAMDLRTRSAEDVLRAVQEIEGGYEAACASIRAVNTRILSENDWTIRESERRLRLRKQEEGLPC